MIKQVFAALASNGGGISSSRCSEQGRPDSGCTGRLLFMSYANGIMLRTWEIDSKIRYNNSMCSS